MFTEKSLAITCHGVYTAHMRNKFVTILIKNLIILTTSLTLIATALPAAAAEEKAEFPEEIFLVEEQSGTCTLASCAMMLRGRIYLSGSDKWEDISDTSLKHIAWTGSGLYYNFIVSLDDEEYLTVGHSFADGISVDELKELLDAHPEGIVLYCSSPLHAVYLTGYEDDTFFCGDPVRDFDNNGKEIDLMDSYIGINYGSVKALLRNVCGYWYIRDYSIITNTAENDSGIAVHQSDIQDILLRDVK